METPARARTDATVEIGAGLSLEVPVSGAEQSSNFLKQIIERDLAEGTHGGRVVTRFPPEPNGYLHIGHAKAVCIGFGLAQEYGGVCHLRFDDTNPAKEETEYVQAIQRDIRWLGFDWGDKLFFASDCFGRMYALAEGLVQDGKAYVDHLTETQIREHRGSVTEPATPSPHRDRSVAENLDLLRRMKAGEFADGHCVLRAKGDLDHPNMKLRDPLLYRIRHQTHHRTGDDWCIYPMYDYAHPIEDALEDVTHSLCSLEFQDNRAIYDWVVDQTAVTSKPRQYEFARLAITYTMMSKRRLLKLVEQGAVSGWDDPRMPTLSGLRRRGVPPGAIRAFVERVGVAKTNSVVEMALFDHVVRDVLNDQAPRLMGVLDPLPVTVTNWEEGRVDWIDADLWPKDVDREGVRQVPFTGELVIERSDFAQVPPKGWRRLVVGGEVRLRHGYLFTCTDVVLDGDAVVGLQGTVDLESRGGKAPDGRKVKGTIHWVSASEGVTAEVRLIDRLFTVEDPGARADWQDHVNPEGLVVRGAALLEPAVREHTGRVQLERLGYFWPDPEDSADGALVYNRIVELKSSWKTPASVAPAVDDKPVIKREGATEGRRKRVRKAKADVVLTPEQEAALAGFSSVGASDKAARLLVDNDAAGALFSAAVAAGADGAATAKLIANDLAGAADDLGALPFGGGELAELVGLLSSGEISNRIAKQVLTVLVADGGSPVDIIESRGLKAVADAGTLGPMIDGIIAANPGQTAAYRGGNARMLGFFVGQVMRQTQGKADPGVVNALLREKLDS
jgi:glutaminyl-tRNA synthetase